jgi:D-aminopeptidase
MRSTFALGLALLVLTPALALGQTRPTDMVDDQRTDARELGLRIGIFEPGEHNAITDVDGVRVGQTTLFEGEGIRTGVTAILPHGGDLFRDRVPAAIYVGNGFGKLVGITQVRELGELETPILLTCTLCVWQAANAMVDWMLARPGMEEVRSINPVVGETNDGGLNDIRSRPLRPEHVVTALQEASGGAVEQGSVGAGTGTRAFGWKGGIGTSSRVLPSSLGGYRVGILVQSNFGGLLTVDGVRVGEALGQYSFRGAVEADEGDGSIMIVIATDAPLSDRNLERLAARAMMGLARTGSFAGNGSGDYVIAFSTAEGVRRSSGEGVPTVEDLPNAATSALFQGVVEATEEAVINSVLRATTVTGDGGTTAEALPLDELRELLREAGRIP